MWCRRAQARFRAHLSPTLTESWYKVPKFFLPWRQHEFSSGCRREGSVSSYQAWGSLAPTPTPVLLHMGLETATVPGLLPYLV